MSGWEVAGQPAVVPGRYGEPDRLGPMWRASKVPGVAAMVGAGQPPA